MSVLRTFADRGESRPSYLLFEIPEIADATFRAEIDALTARLTLTVVYVVAKPTPDWSGERGFITVDLLRRHL